MGDKDFWEMKPILLPSDAAAVRVRRVLTTMLKAEAAENAESEKASEGDLHPHAQS